MQFGEYTVTVGDVMKIGSQVDLILRVVGDVSTCRGKILRLSYPYGTGEVSLGTRRESNGDQRQIGNIFLKVAR